MVPVVAGGIGARLTSPSIQVSAQLLAVPGLLVGVEVKSQAWRYTLAISEKVSVLLSSRKKVSHGVAPPRLHASALLACSLTFRAQGSLTRCARTRVLRAGEGPKVTVHSRSTLSAPSLRRGCGRGGSLPYDHVNSNQQKANRQFA